MMIRLLGERRKLLMNERWCLLRIRMVRRLLSIRKSGIRL